MPPKKKREIRGGTGGSVSRRNRPPWKPQRGQYIMGIPEPVAFAIVMIVAIALLFLAFF